MRTVLPWPVPLRLKERLPCIGPLLGIAVPLWVPLRVVVSVGPLWSAPALSANSVLVQVGNKWSVGTVVMVPFSVLTRLVPGRSYRCAARPHLTAGLEWLGVALGWPWKVLRQLLAGQTVTVGPPVSVAALLSLEK